MPSPIAHISAGYIVFRVLKARCRHFANAGPLVFLFLAGCSLLPDLDSILGFITGDLGRYHNNITHSLCAAIPAALAVFAFLWITRIDRTWLWLPAALLCYELHLLMDFMTYGRGIMALWPLTSERFISPVILFYGLHWSEGMVSLSHLLTVLTEGATAALAIFAVHMLTRRQGNRGQEDSD